MSDETNRYLAHYGVVGMKWGKRSGGSSANKERHADYGTAQQKYDTQQHGAKYAKRVNKQMHEGKNLKEARTIENKRERKNSSIKIALGLSLWAVGTYAGEIAYAGRGAKMKIDEAVMSKQKANGKKHTDGLFADSRGIGSKPMVNLGYNKETDTWE